MKIKYLATLFLIVMTLATSCSSDQQKVEDKENTRTEQLGDNHYKTYTDIVINASAAQVWEVMSDFEKMPDWSSTFQGMKGDLSDGGDVVVTYMIRGEERQVPHTLIWKDGVEYGWSDPMKEPYTGLKDNHHFRIEKISDAQVRFIQTDDFHGEVEGLPKKLADATVQLFPIFNRELKKRVEELAKK